MKGRSRTRLRPFLVSALLGAVLAAPALGDEPLDFPRIVRDTESARGLRFLRPPSLEVVAANDAAFDALLATGTQLWKREDGILLVPVQRAAADPASDRVVALAPPDGREIALALAALLDAQHYPELAREAPRVAGDAGESLRALVAGSAFATASGGLGAPPPEPPQDPLGGPRFEIPEPVSPEAFLRTPVLAATGFLRSLRDREAAFRAPPLSTLALLRPSRWPGPVPAILEGPAAPDPGCVIASDESVGVFALARSVVARGESVPAPALAGWEGDRRVEERCLGGRTRWRYAVVLDDETAARSFVEAAEILAPEAWPRPLAVARSGARVVLSHGQSGAEALAWALSLEPRSLRTLAEAADDQPPLTR